MLRAASLAAYPHGFTGRDHGDFTPPSSAPARLLATLALPGPYAAAAQVHGNRLVALPFEAGVPEA
ncbi:MAG: hypothetical protein FJ102_25670, partial [Deltaproteobacteria bacterium]|nr:hypothetical protein [Deltaproteobacteria bacterium]